MFLLEIGILSLVFSLIAYAVYRFVKEEIEMWKWNNPVPEQGDQPEMAESRA
jgi:hypothetical protein